MLLNSIAFVPAIGALLIFMSILTVFTIVYRLWFSDFSHIPGPRLCKITGLVLAYYDLKLQRTAKVHAWHEIYGPIVLIAPGQVSFSAPSTTREIYGAGSRHPKSSFFDNFIAFGERATFNSLSYETHRERRNYSFSFFQPSSIYQPQFVEPIRARAAAFLDQVRQHFDRSSGTATVDFFQLANRYAFENITNLLFGPGHCTYTVENSATELAMLDDLKYCEVFQPLLFNLPWIYHIFRFLTSKIYGDPIFLSGEHRLEEWTARKVADGQHDDFNAVAAYVGNGHDGTLLRRLEQCKTKSGEPLSESWINAELLDNLNAAQMTVTVSLTYVLWNLARNPQWQISVRQEIANLPMGEDEFPCFGDINKAPILEACIKESYRLNPISSGRAERVVPTGKEYDGIFIPQGTIVSTSTLAMHHSRSIFPRPEVYDPDRWLHPSPEQLRTMERHYMPFGYGARICLGKAFATVEVKLLVAYLLLRFHVTEDPTSLTDIRSMEQLGTQDALPRGLQCNLKFIGAV
ncbi:hypothetical protein PFICI_10850 [Pestalotiopsis fici W106-1]|uniref:Cytochrome P450 n=1 Tax=Pestalotiopsis fici (strain W106-1 / CGMCC3.15140) TaxID=1229662 RepID=W3WVU4_PESFW|nr:uncharacterized protein PFICI_10850 [Pestalotiopsis fici W106-1]ETS76976.1 hypothetical protein PFICI_10850 [Pestalotiopsis fici W106-1]